MTNLSPAAQAVLDAANNELDHAPWDVSYLAKPAVAAALRAVADQVIPTNALYARSCCESACEYIRVDLHIIAAELEAE